MKDIEILNYKAYIFDFDDTLIHSEDIKRQTFFTICEQFNIPPSFMDQALSDHHGRDRSDFFKEVCQKSEQPELFEECLNSYSEVVLNLLAKAPEIQGAQDFLNKLIAEDKLLFVNSATPLKHLEDCINKRSWGNYFHGISGRPTSKTEYCRQIFKKHQLDAKDCLFLGDSMNDLNCAKTLNMPFLGINVKTELLEQTEKIQHKDNFLFAL